ncbi:MAG: hypothetical protein Kow00109_05310 [Acidobacteriota bacterium]
MEEFYRRGRILQRQLVWAIRVQLVTLVVALLGAGSWSDYAVRFVALQRTLVHGHFERAALDLARLERFWFASPRVAFYRHLLAANAGPEPLPSAVREAATSRETFLVRLLTHGALAEGEVKRAERLAALWEELASGEGSARARLYRAAALLEAGRSGEARSLWKDHLQGMDLQGTLAHRVARVLEALQGGARSLLQDRRGNLVGWLTPDGTLKTAEAAVSELLPLQTIRRLLPEQPPATVRLTLDLELSALAKQALAGYRGSIVLVDPESGEILAAYTDRRSRRRFGEAALHQFLETASVTKLVTTVAAFRSGQDPDEEIRGLRCRGALRLGDRYLYCPAPQGRLHGLPDALASSCNIAFARLGTELGAGRLLSELQRFGFDGLLHNGLPTGRVVRRPVNPFLLGELAIGLELVESTPLHGALIAAAVANGGVFLEPRLFAPQDGLLGLHLPETPESTGPRILREDWRRELETAMEAVVAPGGTANGVVPDSLRGLGAVVAMKTGTAATPGLGYHTNYVGYVRGVEHPVAFCVRLTNFRTSKSIQRATRSVTYRLLRDLTRAGWFTRRRETVVPVEWTRLSAGLPDTSAGSR